MAMSPYLRNLSLPQIDTEYERFFFFTKINMFLLSADVSPQPFKSAIFLFFRGSNLQYSWQISLDILFSLSMHISIQYRQAFYRLNLGCRGHDKGCKPNDLKQSGLASVAATQTTTQNYYNFDLLFLSPLSFSFLYILFYFVVFIFFHFSFLFILF